MKIPSFSIALVTTALLVGCETTSHKTSQPRKIKPDEAFSFIRTQASQSTTPYQEPKPLYIQPINKSEPCKLQSSQDQLDRNNLRAFWDGQCKNGFAYGLGRDIAISDTHHLEEIAIYGNDGRTVDSPSVLYDFVHNKVSYRFIRSQPLEMAYFQETIKNEAGSFSISYESGLASPTGYAQIIYWSPLNPQTAYVNIRDNVVYRYVDNKLAGTANSTSPRYSSETLDKSSGMPDGFAAAIYANGQVRHFKAGSGQQELVILPQEYTSEINMRYQEIISTQAKVTSSIEKAKAMEKEYLYLACNGNHKISGLDKSIANKICTWRNQFQEPFKMAQNQYNEYLEKMKSEARSQEEQRRVQEQLDYQKRMAQAAERQAAAAEDANLQNMLNQNKPTTCYSNFGITTCY